MILKSAFGTDAAIFTPKRAKYAKKSKKLKKIFKKLLTLLDKRAIIVNCIIIAYYAFFAVKAEIFCLRDEKFFKMYIIYTRAVRKARI